MGIGPLVPGTPTTVTPDANPPLYTSVDGPAVDGEIIADDVLTAILVALNVQKHISNQHGTSAQMQAVTSATNATSYFHVTGVGWYQYLTGLPLGVSAPFSYMVYAATGVGSGYWVLEDFLSLLSGQPAKIKDTLLPYYQTIDSFQKNTPARIADSLQNQNNYFRTIVDSSTPDHYTVAATLVASPYAYDIVLLNVTPLLVTTVASDFVVLRIRITQNAVTTDYTLPEVPSSQSAPQTFSQIRYVSNGTAAITAALQGTNGASYTSTVAGPYGGWGSTFEWCNGTVLRKF